MCLGGNSSKPAPAPAQAAPVTAASPDLETDVNKKETSSEKASRQRKGKKGLRIPMKGNTANTNSTGSGLNIPKG